MFEAKPAVSDYDNFEEKRFLMFEVRPVVSDYGVFEEKSKSAVAIMNSYFNARLVCAILNYDEKHDGQHLTSKPISKTTLNEIYEDLVQGNDISINSLIVSEYMEKPQS